MAWLSQQYTPPDLDGSVTFHVTLSPHRGDATSHFSGIFPAVVGRIFFTKPRSFARSNSSLPQHPLQSFNVSIWNSAIFFWQT